MASLPIRRRRLALLGCLLAALIAAGCGADDERAGAPLPPAALAELDKQLASIEGRYRFGDGACADIDEDNLPSVRRTLARLPASVDPDVRRALRRSFARLFELARRHCDRHKQAPTPALPTSPVTPPATTTTPVDSTPTATHTATTDSGETSTAKTTPRPPTSRSRTPKPTPRQRDKQPIENPRDAPDTTDGSTADPGSGGTPAPEPRHRRPQS